MSANASPSTGLAAGCGGARSSRPARPAPASAFGCAGMGSVPHRRPGSGRMGYVMSGAAMERAPPATTLARARAAAARAGTRARRHGASNNCTAQLSGTRKMGRAPRTGTVAGARFSPCNDRGHLPNSLVIGGHLVEIRGLTETKPARVAPV